MGLNNKKKSRGTSGHSSHLERPLGRPARSQSAADASFSLRGRHTTEHNNNKRSRRFQTFPGRLVRQPLPRLAATLWNGFLYRAYGVVIFFIFFFRKGFILFLSKNSAHGNTAERNDNERSRRFSRPSSKVLVLVIFGTDPTKFTALLLGLMDFLSNRLFMALLSYSVFIEENVVYEFFFSTTFRRFCFFIDSHSVFCRFFFYERSRTSYLGNWTHFHFV